MSRKTVSIMILFLLVISTLTLAFKIQSVKADSGTGTINSAPETFYFHSTHASTPANPIDSWVMDFSPPAGTLYSYTTGPGTGGADVVFSFGPVAPLLTIDSGNWSCYVYVSNTTTSSMILDIGESTGQFGELFTSLWTAIFWAPKAGWNTITWSDSSSRVVHPGNYLAIDTRLASNGSVTFPPPPPGSITLLWDTDTYDSRLVSPPAQSGSTSVICSPNSVSPGSSVTCTATVLGSNPTGTVTWSTNSSTGSFYSSISTLSSGSCSTNYADTSAGNVTITASYSGDPDNTPSSGTCVLQVIQHYNVTFGQTGVGLDFTGPVLTVDGTNYTANDLPTSFSWDNGSTHTFTFQSPLIAEANAEQYVWAGTSGLSATQSGSINVTTDGSIVGSYETQYNVTFDSTGVGSDFTGPIVVIDGSNYNVSALPTSFWYDSGSTHSFAYQSPLVGSLAYYEWNSTTGLSTLQSGSITITGAGNVTGNYLMHERNHSYERNSHHYVGLPRMDTHDQRHSRERRGFQRIRRVSHPVLRRNSRQERKHIPINLGPRTKPDANIHMEH